MTLLEIVILAHRCRSTHHFIAFDALQLLEGPDAQDWKNLLLRHHEKLLKGAKAPDAEFKDFQNHVLHVEEGEWGGARDAAMLWYGKAVEALRAQKWGEAAYALGVLTHYYADPIQPFHTAQSEEEGAIHRAVEWSIAKSRDTLKAMIDARGYPIVYAGNQSGFVADMVLEGARYSNQYYWTLINHYDIDRGVVDPPAGLDATLLDILADLIAYATSGVAVLFERAFAEAGVKPKKVDLDLPGYLAALDIPIRRLTKKINDAADRRTVEKMYEELVDTGKVIKTLSEDDKKIRAMHAKQVLRKPLAELDAQPLQALGTQHVPQAAHAKPVRYEMRVVPVLNETPTETHAPEDVAVLPDELPAPAEPIQNDVPEPVNEPVNDAAPDVIAVLTPVPEPMPERKADTPLQSETELTSTSTVQIEEPPAPMESETYGGSETVPPALQAAPDEPVAANAARDAVQQSEPAPERDVLSAESPVVDAPSIGPKTAARLAKLDIVTIADLLAVDPEAAAAELGVRYIKPATISDWQDQTRLMLDAPGLRVLDSQILIGVGIRSADDLAKASATRILKAATNFLDTPQGARVLWGGENTVDKAYVEQWIDLAKSARTQAA